MPKVTAHMQAHVAIVKDSSKCSDVVRTMLKNDVDYVVVVDEDKVPLGIITEKDLVRRVVSKRAEPEKIDVRDVMSSPLVTVAESTSLDEAARLMLERRISHLVVVSEGNRSMLGILISSDILKELQFIKWI